MIDKAVQDFAVGEKSLLPAFEALDSNGDGCISQEDLVQTIENFCNALPETDGCDVDERPLRLAQAFNAFANDEQLLDYERFVEMISGRMRVKVTVTVMAVTVTVTVTVTVRVLDYERFVKMILGTAHAHVHIHTYMAGRKEGADECELEVEDEAAARRRAYLEEEMEMMGERDCFGDATTEEGDDDPGCDAWFYGEVRGSSPTVSYSLLPTPYSPLPAPCSLLPTACCLLPTPYSLLPTPYSPLPTPCSLLPAAYSLLPTLYSLLPFRTPMRASLSRPIRSRRYACIHAYIYTCMHVEADPVKEVQLKVVLTLTLTLASTRSLTLILRLALALTLALTLTLARAPTLTRRSSRQRVSTWRSFVKRGRRRRPRRRKRGPVSRSRASWARPLTF